MAITPTELRANIYKIIDGVLETGIPVEVERDGKTVLIVPKAGGKLKNIIERPGAYRGDPDEIAKIDWSAEWRP